MKEFAKENLLDERARRLKLIEYFGERLAQRQGLVPTPGLPTEAPAPVEPAPGEGADAGAPAEAPVATAPEQEPTAEPEGEAPSAE
jgi:hypothetical protein